MRLWPSTAVLLGEERLSQPRADALKALKHTKILANSPEPADMAWLFAGADLSQVASVARKGTLVIAEPSAFASPEEAKELVKFCLAAGARLAPVSSALRRESLAKALAALPPARDGARLLKLTLANAPLGAFISPSGGIEAVKRAFAAESALSALSLSADGKLRAKGFLHYVRSAETNAFCFTADCGPIFFEARMSSGAASAKTTHTAELYEESRKLWSLEFSGSQAVMNDGKRPRPIHERGEFDEIVGSVLPQYIGGTLKSEPTDLYKACVAAKSALDWDAGKESALLLLCPRVRDPFDELYLPSIALGRLTAYLRQIGATTDVADLDAAKRLQEADCQCFHDADRVRRFLAGSSDSQFEAILAPHAAEVLRKAPADVTGFSVTDNGTGLEIRVASCIAKLLRIKGWKSLYALGGEADAVTPEIARGPNSPFDFIALGDGEIPLAKLCAAVKKADRPLWSIEGTHYAKADSFDRNAEAEHIALDVKPTPDFSAHPLEKYRYRPTPEVAQYLRDEGINLPDDSSALVLPYYYIRGCAHNCIFCARHLSGAEIQSPQKTVAELKELSEKYRTKYFMFLNSTFNMTPRALEETLSAFEGFGLDILFWDCARPQFFNADLARRAASIGLTVASIGLESASDKILRLMRKGNTAKQAGETLKSLGEAGVINRVNFIPGFAREDENDVRDTEKFIDEFGRYMHVLGCFQPFHIDDPSANAESLGVRLRAETAQMPAGVSTIAYDEIGGRSWEEHKPAIIDSYERIEARIKKAGIFEEQTINPGPIFLIYDFAPNKLKAQEVALKFVRRFWVKNLERKYE